jgi:allantoate deiminase
VLDLADESGTTMRDAMRAFGLDPSKIGDAARAKDEVLAYAELHIEQGPVLEGEALPLGVVTAINGGSRFSITLTGEAGHAGTVPMGMRRDALNAAAECALAVERIVTATPDAVATVGRLEPFPGAMNVIPGKVHFSLDVRAPTDEKRTTVIAALRDEFAAITARRRIDVAWTPLWEAPTTPCAPFIQAQLAAAIAHEGLQVRNLPSGAGHDGMAISALAPIGMLFVRCLRGISHNPAESITVEDIDIAARVFLRFIEHFEPAAKTRGSS